MELNTIGSRIRAVRVARGMALGECAKEIGVSRTSLSQWEAGNVKDPNITALTALTEVMDCSLEWIIERKGPDPVLSPSIAAPRRRRPPVGHEGAPESPLIGNSPPADTVPEISPALQDHAGGLDMAPRAVWNIPGAVQELRFNSTLGQTAIMRVLASELTEGGGERGDYVLIDTSRKRIDEAGIWLIADPVGGSARRVHARQDGERLRVVALSDNLEQENQELDPFRTPALGRIMGIFRPV
jgi:transcriptional regulator with XRE-family HTH domain